MENVLGAEELAGKFGLQPEAVRPKVLNEEELLNAFMPKPKQEESLESLGIQKEQRTISDEERYAPQPTMQQLPSEEEGGPSSAAMLNDAHKLMSQYNASESEFARISGMQGLEAVPAKAFHAVELGIDAMNTAKNAVIDVGTWIPRKAVGAIGGVEGENAIDYVVRKLKNVTDTSTEWTKPGPESTLGVELRPPKDAAEAATYFIGEHLPSLIADYFTFIGPLGRVIEGTTAARAVTSALPVAGRAATLGANLGAYSAVEGILNTPAQVKDKEGNVINAKEIKAHLKNIPVATLEQVAIGALAGAFAARAGQEGMDLGQKLLYKLGEIASFTAAPAMMHGEAPQTAEILEGLGYLFAFNTMGKLAGPKLSFRYDPQYDADTKYPEFNPRADAGQVVLGTNEAMRPTMQTEGLSAREVPITWTLPEQMNPYESIEDVTYAIEERLATLAKSKPRAVFEAGTNPQGADAKPASEVKKQNTSGLADSLDALMLHKLATTGSAELTEADLKNAADGDEATFKTLNEALEAKKKQEVVQPEAKTKELADSIKDEIEETKKEPTLEEEQAAAEWANETAKVEELPLAQPVEELVKPVETVESNVEIAELPVAEVAPVASVEWTHPRIDRTNYIRKRVNYLFPGAPGQAGNVNAQLRNTLISELDKAGDTLNHIGIDLVTKSVVRDKEEGLGATRSHIVDYIQKAQAAQVEAVKNLKQDEEVSALPRTNYPTRVPKPMDEKLAQQRRQTRIENTVKLIANNATAAMSPAEQTTLYDSLKLAFQGRTPQKGRYAIGDTPGVIDTIIGQMNGKKLDFVKANELVNWFEQLKGATGEPVTFNGRGANNALVKLWTDKLANLEKESPSVTEEQRMAGVVETVKGETEEELHTLADGTLVDTETLGEFNKSQEAKNLAEYVVKEKAEAKVKASEPIEYTLARFEQVHLKQGGLSTGFEAGKRVPVGEVAEYPEWNHAKVILELMGKEGQALVDEVSGRTESVDKLEDLVRTMKNRLEDGMDVKFFNFYEASPKELRLFRDAAAELGVRLPVDYKDKYPKAEKPIEDTKVTKLIMIQDKVENVIKGLGFKVKWSDEPAPPPTKEELKYYGWESAEGHTVGARVNYGKKLVTVYFDGDAYSLSHELAHIIAEKLDSKSLAYREAINSFTEIANNTPHRIESLVDNLSNAIIRDITELHQPGAFAELGREFGFSMLRTMAKLGFKAHSIKALVHDVMEQRANVEYREEDGSRTEIRAKRGGHALFEKHSNVTRLQLKGNAAERDALIARLMSNKPMSKEQQAKLHVLLNEDPSLRQWTKLGLGKDLGIDDVRKQRLAEQYAERYGLSVDNVKMLLSTENGAKQLMAMTPQPKPKSPRAILSARATAIVDKGFSLDLISRVLDGMDNANDATMIKQLIETRLAQRTASMLQHAHKYLYSVEGMVPIIKQKLFEDTSFGKNKNSQEFKDVLSNLEKLGQDTVSATMQEAKMLWDMSQRSDLGLSVADMRSIRAVSTKLLKEATGSKTKVIPFAVMDGDGPRMGMTRTQRIVDSIAKNTWLRLDSMGALTRLGAPKTGLAIKTSGGRKDIVYRLSLDAQSQISHLVHYVAMKGKMARYKEAATFMSHIPLRYEGSQRYWDEIGKKYEETLSTEQLKVMIQCEEIFGKALNELRDQIGGEKIDFYAGERKRLEAKALEAEKAYWKAINGAGGKDTSTSQIAFQEHQKYMARIAELDQLKFAPLPRKAVDENTKALHELHGRKGFTIYNSYSPENGKPGRVSLTDFNVIDLLGDYAERVGRDAVMIELARAAVEDGSKVTLHKLDTGNMEVEGYTTIEHPAFSGLLVKNEVVHEIYRGVLAGWNSGKVMRSIQTGLRVMKGLKFYNPTVMPVVNLLQGLVAGTSPQYYYEGWKEVMNSGEWYKRAVIAGAISNPANALGMDIANTQRRYKAGNEGADKLLRLVTGSSWGEAVMLQQEGKTLEAVGRLLSDNVVTEMYRASSDIAWTCDEAMRVGLFKQLMEKGNTFLGKEIGPKFTEEQAGAIVSRVFSDYGAIPASARKKLNLFFFTPSYIISMHKLVAVTAKETYELAKNLGTGQQSNAQVWASGLMFGRMMLVTGVTAQLMHMLGYDNDKEHWWTKWVPGFQYSKNVYNARLNRMQDVVVRPNLPTSVPMREMNKALTVIGKLVNSPEDFAKTPFNTYVAYKSMLQPALTFTLATVFGGTDRMGQPIYNELDSASTKTYKTAKVYLNETIPLLGVGLKYGERAAGAYQPVATDDAAEMVAKGWGSLAVGGLSYFINPYTRESTNVREAAELKGLSNRAIRSIIKMKLNKEELPDGLMERLDEKLDEIHERYENR